MVDPIENNTKYDIFYILSHDLALLDFKFYSTMNENLFETKIDCPIKKNQIVHLFNGEIVRIFSENENFIKFRNYLNQMILDTKIRYLIENNKIILFMKGSPYHPRCKFSRELLEIFKVNE